LFLNATFLGQQWNLHLFLFDNGENKYNCSFERIQDNDVYLKLHFVTPDGSNDRQSRIKLCAQRITCPTTNWVGNCIIVMVWIGLLPICISIIFCSIGVQFLSRVGNFLYIVNSQILCWFQFDNFENVSMLMIFERFMYNL
jgi:hypothetical protein